MITYPVYKHNAKQVDIPLDLEGLQKWFASIITNRLDENGQIQAISPHGFVIAEEASLYVTHSPTLKPHERIQIYNQQYWWRLIKIMHENFPLVTRLFGYYSFNEFIAIPYLLKYPPNHWSLGTLGKHLADWIEKEYHAADKKLVLNSVKLDWAFIAIFISPSLPFLDFSTLINGNPESLFSYTFYLQPYIYLFHWNHDLIHFREKFLEHDVDHWTKHDFPEIPKGKNYFYVLYRANNNYVGWLEISHAQHTILNAFLNGATIETACEALEKEGDDVYEDAEKNLQKWLQEWVSFGWLTLEKQKNEE